MFSLCRYVLEGNFYFFFSTTAFCDSPLCGCSTICLIFSYCLVFWLFPTQQILIGTCYSLEMLWRSIRYIRSYFFSCGVWDWICELERLCSLHISARDWVAFTFQQKRLRIPMLQNLIANWTKVVSPEKGIVQEHFICRKSNIIVQNG